MNKKIITSLLVFSILLPSIIIPGIANAQSLEAKIAGWLTGIPVAASNVAAGSTLTAFSVPIVDVAVLEKEIPNEATDTFREIAFSLIEFLIGTLRKIILDQLVDGIVSWIQGGGEPKFVTNFTGFLQDAVDSAIGETVSQALGEWVCSPYSLQLKLSLLPTPKFSDQACTLSGIADNFEQFIDNFQNGSWITLNRAWTPENTFYGQVVMLYDRALNKSIEERRSHELESASGGSFLSKTKCNGGTITLTQYQLLDPGAQQGYARDDDGRICRKENISVTTPGSVIAGLTTKSLGIDLDWLLSSDELTHYLTAIVNAAVNRALTEGLAAMRGNAQTGRDTGLYDSYLSSLTSNQSAFSQVAQERADISLRPFQKIIDYQNELIIIKQQSLLLAQNLQILLEKANEKLATVSGASSGDTSGTITYCPIPPIKIQITQNDFRKLIEERLGNRLTAGGIVDQIDQQVLTELNRLILPKEVSEDYAGQEVARLQQEIIFASSTITISQDVINEAKAGQAETQPLSDNLTEAVLGLSNNLTNQQQLSDGVINELSDKAQQEPFRTLSQEALVGTTKQNAQNELESKQLILILMQQKFEALPSVCQLQNLNE